MIDASTLSWIEAGHAHADGNIPLTVRLLDAAADLALAEVHSLNALSIQIANQTLAIGTDQDVPRRHLDAIDAVLTKQIDLVAERVDQISLVCRRRRILQQPIGHDRLQIASRIQHLMELRRSDLRYFADSDRTEDTASTIRNGTNAKAWRRRRR